MIRSRNSSDKIFIIVIALLLIANVATLTLLLTGKRPDTDDRKNAMRNYLKNEVDFNEKQLEAYDTIKMTHRSEAKNMFEGLKQEKQNNLKLVGNAGFSDSVILTAAKAAALQQENIELKMLRHIKDVRTLCTPAQQAIFDTGFYKIMVRQGPSVKKKEN